MVEREREITMSNIETLIPSAYDVILGRGKRNDLHLGNVHFRRLVASQRPGYLLAGDDKEQKRSIVKWVMNHVFDAGGRFVAAAAPHRRGSDKSEVYLEVSMLEAQKKTAQALREKCTKRPGPKTTAQSTCMGPTRRRTRVGKVLVEGLKKDATPIDAHLNEAIKVLDDDSDECDTVTVAISGRGIVPPPAVTSPFGQVSRGTQGDPEEICKTKTATEGPNLCHMCYCIMEPAETAWLLQKHG
jgi:hypothetical protein